MGSGTHNTHQQRYTVARRATLYAVVAVGLPCAREEYCKDYEQRAQLASSLQPSRSSDHDVRHGSWAHEDGWKDL